MGRGVMETTTFLFPMPDSWQCAVVAVWGYKGRVLSSKTIRLDILRKEVARQPGGLIDKMQADRLARYLGNLQLHWGLKPNQFYNYSDDELIYFAIIPPQVGASMVLVMVGELADVAPNDPILAHSLPLPERLSALENGKFWRFL